MEPFPFFIPELGHEKLKLTRTLVDWSRPLYRAFNKTRKTRNGKVKSSVECCGAGLFVNKNCSCSSRGREVAGRRVAG